MGRSQDTYNKKELEKKRKKKKKDKRERREQRKLDGAKSPEFMYVDSEGNLTATQPDPADKKKIKIEDIAISTPKQEKSDMPNFMRTGILKFFNSEKGYGFITDSDSKESVFVHIDAMEDEIKENDKVVFELGKGPKGPIANGVKLA